MRTLFAMATVSAAFLVSGCVTTGFVPGGPAPVWSKAGTTRAQRKAEYEDCWFKAVKEIPPAMATHFDPGLHIPGSVMCSGYGTYVSCRQVGGVDVPASASTVDRNEGVRKRYAEVCMEKRGFVQAQGKFCMSPDDTTTEDCVVVRP